MDRYRAGTVAEPFLNPIGGRIRSGAWMQQTSLAASFGSGPAQSPSNWRELDHWIFDLELALLNGNPNDGAQIGAVYSPQELFDPVGLWPAGFSLRRRPRTGRWGWQRACLHWSPPSSRHPSTAST